MLEKLFGSNARVKILKIFLSNPDEKFFMRGLSRDLKLQLNSVRRELDNLETLGLLTSNPDLMDKDGVNGEEEYMIVSSKDAKEHEQKKKVANVKEKVSKQDKKYYQVNKNHILFEEIKRLILKAQVLHEKDFVEKVKKIGNIKLLLLSGFFLNKESRVDLLIVGKFDQSKLKKLISNLEKEVGREINYTIMDPNEFKQRREIADVFLYGILEEEKVVLIDEYNIF